MANFASAERFADSVRKFAVVPTLPFVIIAAYFVDYFDFGAADCSVLIVVVVVDSTDSSGADCCVPIADPVTKSAVPLALTVDHFVRLCSIADLLDPIVDFLEAAAGSIAEFPVPSVDVGSSASGDLANSMFDHPV